MRRIVTTMVLILTLLLIGSVRVDAFPRQSRIGTPSIRVLSPTKTVTVGADGKIDLSLKISGITLAPGLMGRKAVPGQGHFHFYLDCIPSKAYSQPNNFGGCWAGAEASDRVVFDLAASHVKVSPGTHVLLIALAQNDHVLLPVPPASVIFRVVNTPITLQLISPRTPVSVEQNGHIPINLKIGGLTLDASQMGKKHVAGHGHIHFYVDCVPADAYVRPNLSTCWANAVTSARGNFDLSTSHVKVKSGTHLLFIALARNDHILYRVPVVSVVFTVLPAG